MTLLLSNYYLRHEWVFWPLCVMRILTWIGEAAFDILVWGPRMILRLIDERPSLIVEFISMLSALLFSLWVNEITSMWRLTSGVLGLAQLAVLVQGGWEGRVKVMIVSTVFWWCVAFAFLPKRFVVSHVFLLPLCWAYAVTALSLLRRCDDGREQR